MIADWKKFLRDRAADWNLPSGDRWGCLFHNNYHSHCSSINLLWFYGGGESPQVVTKLYRQPDVLQREFTGLQKAHPGAPRVVPRPLHFGQIGEFWTLWMEGVPGSRFRVEQSASSAALQSAADAIIAFHQGVRFATPPDPNRWDRMVSRPIDAVSRFGSSAVIERGCSSLASAVSPDWLLSLPVIPQHGDLFSENLLTAKAGCHIVDWESFGLVDLPLYDLLTFCLSLFPADSAPPDQWTSSWLDQIPKLVDRYCQSLGLDRQQIRFLLPLTLVNWFQLHWAEGRREFNHRLYRIMERYFADVDLWNQLILSGRQA
jgi:aminoglycoside phosphotransferase (APT) family kinase protein